VLQVLLQIKLTIQDMQRQYLMQSQHKLRKITRTKDEIIKTLQETVRKQTIIMGKFVGIFALVESK